MSHLFSAAVESYKERRAKNNLKIAIESALGSSLKFEKYIELQSSTEKDKKMSKDLTSILNDHNLSLAYPLIESPNLYSNNINETEKFLKYSNNPLNIHRNIHGLYFFHQDANLIAKEYEEDKEKFNNDTVVWFVSKAKTVASKVYAGPDDIEDINPATLGCTIKTLRMVNAMDNIFNLSKIPSSFELTILMKNQSFVESYYIKEKDYKNNLNPEELIDENSSKISVKFNDQIFIKEFEKNQLPTSIQAKSISHVTEKKKILKNRKNENFAKEIELAHFCDFIDIAQFIRLLDNKLRKRMKRHEQLKMDYEYKKVEQSNLTLEPIISDDEKSSIFKTLLDNLFVNDSSEFNDSTIKQLHIDQEKVEILTSWFNETSNDMNVFKVTKSINEFTGIPYTIFNDYIKSDRTKTLWELFKLLDNKSLKKYIYQNRPDFIMYVCTRPEDSLNDQPLSIVSLEKEPTTITLDKVLSPQDEIFFEKYLLRNKQFIVTSKSKKTDFQQNFPLYFGTTENEINPHRKMALRQKRLVKDPYYNTPQSLQNQRNIKKSSLAPASVQQIKKSVQTVSTSIQQKTNGTAKTSTSKIATPAQSLQTKSTTVTINTKKQEKTPTPSTPVPESILTPATPVTPAQAPATAPVTPIIPKTPVVSTKETVKPVSVQTMANLLASGTKTKTLAESLKRTASPSSSPSPSSRSKLVSKSTTASPSSSSVAVFDTVSAEFLSGAPKSLGITLLRIMFDSQYISRIFNSNVDENSRIIPHGLQNSGNICYMNSILQFLFYCAPFSQILNIIRESTIKELDETKSNTPILDALLDLQDSFKIASKIPNKFDTINPDRFYSSIASLSRFSHLSWGQQEDAEEFLNILLDGLHEEFVESIKIISTPEVNRFANAFTNKETTRKILQNVDFIKDSSKENASALDNSDNWNEVGSNMKTIGKRSFQVKLSPIVNLFGGQFKSVLKASNKKSSITLDPFMQVQLDISDPETTDLITAFEKFSQDEEVSLGSTMAKKQNFIDKLPSILIIHLKRFSFVTNDESNSENANYEIVGKNKKKKGGKEAQQANLAQQSKAKLLDGRIEKIHKFIKYDHKLTLPKSCISTMVSEEPNYKLLGVVYHHGRSTENGHYTADVLTSADQWVRIDDTNITNITEADAVSDQNLLSNINKTAYILMFQKI
ncbi:hypothetical protein C6P42_003214 [Pichia californica]|nr:hypothetical protein C6P42_003214 [[Candida] californica]